MTEGAGTDINPQAESTLDKMAGGMTENTGHADQANASAGPAAGTEGNIQTDVEGNIQRDTQEGDIHQQIENKMNKMAQKMFEED